MRRPALLSAALFSVVVPSHAQDARDDEIFGGDAPAAAAAPAAPATSPLIDTLQIGGRLEIRANTGQEEQQKLADASFRQLKQADVYFDARPRPDFRAFLRLRLAEETPTLPPVGAASRGGPSTEIDELWVKGTQAQTVFYTYGKQHLKWGSGRFWNPTDFTATEIRDPFALFDRRLGQDLLKIHVPVERLGYNFYGVLQLDDASRTGEIGGALRAELAFLGRGEAALSFQARADAPLRYGVDVSTALGPIDVYVETALTRRERRTFYRGVVDPALGRLPEAYQEDEAKLFTQTVGGIQYAWKYNADDAVTVGGEYFSNGLGYDDRELALYAIVSGDAEPLYAGRRYAGAFVRLPNPGSWNKTSFFVNGIRNLTDETSVARLTATWEVLQHATIEAFVSQCQGDYGELCFRVPESYRALAAAPTVPEPLRLRAQTLPTKRTLATAGVGVATTF